MKRQEPFARSGFQLFRPIATRWMDVDTYGHVNNVEYLSYFDTAVNGWYLEEQLLNPRTSSELFIVAGTSCQFFSEIVFGDVVDIGIRVAHLGRASVRYDLALFVGDEPHARAQGTYTHVLVEREGRKAVAIAGRRREMLERLLVTPNSAGETP